MKKGCIIAVASVLVVLCAGVVVIYVLASQYEKQPKKPGEAELWAAEQIVGAYKDQEGSGNTPDAIAFARDYGRKLRISRQVLFTKGNATAVSLTKGYFLTYCFEKEDSLAVLVHVPELRHYAEDAKVTLGEYAWTLATVEAHARFPKVKRLAVGVRGALNYSTIFTGVIDNQDPMRGIRERHSTISTEPLYPFFAAPLKADVEAKP